MPASSPASRAVPSASPSAASILALWALFSLLAATLELVVLGFRAFVVGSFVLVDEQTVWMNPLSYLMWLLAPTVVLLVASRIAPRWIGGGAVVFTLAFGSAFSVLFLAHPHLHAAAVALLALGLAAQAARIMAPVLTKVARSGLRVAVALAAFYAMSGLAVNAWGAVAERSAARGLPPATADSPNILLLILDTVRASSLSLYGHPRPTTPTLEARAAASTVFSTAFSTAPWTLTSHASVFTGRYPSELTATWTTPLDDSDPTLAEVFTGRGYRTGGFVANLLYTGAETGLARGFHRYEDYRVSLPEIAISSSLGRIVVNNPRLRALTGYHDIPGRRTVDDIVDRFLRWAGQDRARPFFAFLNVYDAHEPYLPPEPFASRFATGTPRSNHFIRQANMRSADRISKELMTEPERREEEHAYEAAIASIDQSIGRMLAALEEDGRLENTIVVVTSDHGELFGEHGLFAHGGELYTQTLHVPLLLMGPGVPRGVRVAEAVSLVDLAATLAELASVPGSGLGGTSLAPLWLDGDASSTPQSPVFSEVEPARNQAASMPSSRGPMKSLVRYPYHYILNGDGVEEVYDLSVDPAEFEDLAPVAGNEALVASLREELARLAPRRE